MTYATLSNDGPVRIVTLNRPERLNAISGALMVDLHDALARAQADPDARAIVLTGAGRAFCAGDDLKEFDEQAQDTASIAEHVERMVELCPQPLARHVALLMDYSPRRPRGTEVPDPYYGSPAGFERVLDLIEEACDGLIADLRMRLAMPP